MDGFFGTTGQVLWWQECTRAVLVFVFGLVLVRVAGRRIFGRWSAIDIVVSIMIGSNLSRALTGNAELWGTLAATTLLVALHWVFAHLASRWAALSRLVEGVAVPLARLGQPLTSTFHRHSISAADLHEALRQAGVEDLGATKLVTLEPSGKISVLKSG